MNARCRAMAAIAIVASLLLARVAAHAGELEAAPCPSAYEEGVPLTLPAAVDLALCHNAQVHGAWAGIRLQAAGVGEARAASSMACAARWPAARPPKSNKRQDRLSEPVLLARLLEAVLAPG